MAKDDLGTIEKASLEQDHQGSRSASSSTLDTNVNVQNDHASQQDKDGLPDIEKADTVHSHHGGPREHPATKVVTAQDWTGPDDPENPLNWSWGKKIYHTAMVGFLCFAATAGSSIYTPGYPEIKKQFNVSTTASFLPLTVYVLGLGCGPVLAAPISETFGRRIVYLTTFPCFMFFTLGCGFAQNFGTLIVCRFFAGTFSAPSLAVGAGTMSDIYPPLYRALSSAIFTLMPFLGPAMGPPIGGYAVLYQNWRWTQWSLLFISIGAYVFSLFQSETYKKIILQKRAKRLGIPPPPNPLPPGLARIKFLLVVTIFRPVRMIFTEPIVSAFSTYTAFNFSMLFAFFAAFPLIFRGLYGFNSGQAGLVFIAIGIGNIIGTCIIFVIDRLTYRKWTLERISRGDHTPLPPETRLYGAMIGSFLLPVSLFWVGWTARADIHWIAPLLGTIPFATGNLLVFNSCIVYMIDTYGPMGGASASAANGLMRYTSGAVFPLFTQQMYHTLGIDWATSLLAFITILLLPIPWILRKWGPALRSRSEYGVGGRTSGQK